jgi:hypothetical protein
MNITIQDIYPYDSVDDREIIARYQSDPKEIYIAVLLFRYEFLIYKVISQWHTRNQHIEFNDSDYLDMRHVGYHALSYMMSRVGDPHSIKNVSSRIKQYVVNAINREYKHRRYETVFDTELHPANSTAVGDIENDLLKREIDPAEILRSNFFLYLVYHYNYDYYKLGLMFYAADSRKALKNHFSRVKRKIISKLKEKYMPTD